jgi:hypothetical protein
MEVEYEDEAFLALVDQLEQRIISQPGNRQDGIQSDIPVEYCDQEELDFLTQVEAGALSQAASKLQDALNPTLQKSMHATNAGSHPADKENFKLDVTSNGHQHLISNSPHEHPLQSASNQMPSPVGESAGATTAHPPFKPTNENTSFRVR